MRALVTLRTIFGRLGGVRSEAGFTLIEVLVATALSTIVLTAVLSALESSQHAQSRDQEWALVIQEGRTGLARMAREMRQAYSITNDSHSAIEFYATISGKSYRISYDCHEPEAGVSGYYRCVRRELEFKEVSKKYAPPSEAEVAKQTGEATVRYVLNGSTACETKKECVFQEYTPNQISPDLITIKVVLPAAGTLKIAGAATYAHHIILENGAYVRDMALGV